MSCSGGKFELIKIPLVTLIDTLDTLVILGNYTEFKRAIRLISLEIYSFNYDTSVSVFETTIRILGGLLSAHLFAIDPLLQIYVCKTIFLSFHIIIIIFLFIYLFSPVLKVINMTVIYYVLQQMLVIVYYLLLEQQLVFHMVQ